jgi:hypothetical protein
MTNQHPITPPRELMEQWASEKCYDERDWLYEFHIATRAAQWGADQELEACCEWLKEGWDEIRADKLRASRRPQPPSLKEQALEQLESVQCLLDMHKLRSDTIRRALEALPDD